MSDRAIYPCNVCGFQMGDCPSRAVCSKIRNLTRVQVRYDKEIHEELTYIRKLQEAVAILQKEVAELKKFKDETLGCAPELGETYDVALDSFDEEKAKFTTE